MAGVVHFSRTLFADIRKYETSTSGPQPAVHCPTISLVLPRLARVKDGQLLPIELRRRMSNLETPSGEVYKLNLILI